MNELDNILIEHFKKYPQMQPVDAIKLIYQNEFGGGHIVTDKNKAERFLREEYANLQKRAAVPLFEVIGNGLCRVNLAALNAEKLDELFCAFVASASEVSGRLDSFIQKLDYLCAFTLKNAAPFSQKIFDEELAVYARRGYPMVSHSEIYRQQYTPHYRVVLEKYARNL